MDAVREILLEQIRTKQQSQAQVRSFVRKVVCVLLAEGFSTTFYQVMTAIIVGDGTMTDLQALIARSIYAAFITLYAPVVVWLVAKTGRIMTGRSFPATSVKLKTTICPVLLAWGWKDWAAQLDSWAGVELWDEAVLAVCLTLVVLVLQALPVYIRAKKGVVAGGREDNLFRRIIIFPSSLMLTLGYVWNMVARWFVTKVQDLHKVNLEDSDAYAYHFMVQTAYTIILGIIVTLVSVKIIKAKTESNRVSVEHRDGHAQTVWADVADVALSIMSFVYAWAVLDVCDDWGFGLMFNCTGPTRCSYQSNFVYSVCVTVCFAVVATMLNSWQQFEDGPILKTMLGLQINAMVLTVGWAWMNFYTVLISSATLHVDVGTSVVVYLLVLVAILIFTSMVMHMLESIKHGLAARSKQHIDALEAFGKPPRLPEGISQSRCSEVEVKARYKTADESLPG